MVGQAWEEAGEQLTDEITGGPLLHVRDFSQDKGTVRAGHTSQIESPNIFLIFKILSPPNKIG